MAREVDTEIMFKRWIKCFIYTVFGFLSLAAFVPSVYFLHDTIEKVTFLSSGEVFIFFILAIMLLPPFKHRFFLKQIFRGPFWRFPSSRLTFVVGVLIGL